MSQLLLCPDTDVSPDITLTDNGSCFDTIWENGEIVDQGEYDLSSLEFVCESLPQGVFPDFAVSDMGCPVVSEKLKTLLQANGIDNIEYFPATVIESKGSAPKNGYFAANIVGLVDCIDKEESDFDGIERNGELRAISSIDELVLLVNESETLPIYRAFMFRRLIIVAERFEAVFKAAGIKGIKFILPERWDGFNGEK